MGSGTVKKFQVKATHKGGPLVINYKIFLSNYRFKSYFASTICGYAEETLTHIIYMSSIEVCLCGMGLLYFAVENVA